MRRTANPADDQISSSGKQPELLDADIKGSQPKRTATVYDAVAGRIGLRGFLTRQQMDEGRVIPSTPEEVLLRRVNAPDQIPYGFYDADERLSASQTLPDSDLLKAIHTFASDFYAANTSDKGLTDFRSFDETALLAFGILLEEASKEVLGENGDMTFTEPEGMEHDMPEPRAVRHQIAGKVSPRRAEHQEASDDSLDLLLQEESPRKRRR